MSSAGGYCSFWVLSCGTAGKQVCELNDLFERPSNGVVGNVGTLLLTTQSVNGDDTPYPV